MPKVGDNEDDKIVASPRGNSPPGASLYLFKCKMPFDILVEIYPFGI